MREPKVGYNIYLVKLLTLMDQLPVVMPKSCREFKLLRQIAVKKGI
jgi:hypothetical protein